MKRTDCCGDSEQKNTEAASCCGGEGKTVLLYACSGGSNVAEIADRAARGLAADGCGRMFCLAGLGADIQGMVQSARDSDLNLVIDGCPVECAKKIFDRHNIGNYRRMKVTDLGIEKSTGTPCTQEQVNTAIAEARKLAG